MHIFSNRQFSNGRLSRHPAALSPVRIGFGQHLCQVLLLTLFMNLSGAMSAGATTRDEQIATIKSQMNNAIFRVQEIVNQPVTHLKHTPGMNVAFYSPGWFHAGAIKPDFNTVDVRATQQLDYDGDRYVTSDLNSGVVFIGRELEFNPMTKYFYTDRSVPKKKLTEAEMLEINQLYRVIGRCEQQLNELQNPESPLTTFHRLVSTHKPAAIALVAVLVVTLVVVGKRRSQALENQ